MSHQVLSPELTLFLQGLPSEPGVYRMKDEQGSVLYVGKAANLKKRVVSYFQKKLHSAKTSSLIQQVISVEITVTRSETEALLLESNLIKDLRPKYNILLRDDKSYSYIQVSDHPQFPRIEAYRSKKKPLKGHFFGPYPSGAAVKETLITIQKVFKIRNCRDSYFQTRSRPCLQYQIQRCSAPCVGYISPEEYRLSLNQALSFLQGKSQAILDDLADRMDKAVLQLHFEEAAVLRDQIKKLRLAQEQQAVVQLHGEADVIAMDLDFACILCVRIRKGQVLASQSFFPKLPLELHEEESPDREALWLSMLEAFVGFYYLDYKERIPALILTQQVPIDSKVLEQALSQQRGAVCKIQRPKRGGQSLWMDFALNNLRIAVTEKQYQKLASRMRYQELEQCLNLSKSIERMECFDISHTQGNATVASCVVFDEKGPVIKEYRRFNIEGITPGDDYAAMEQAIRRRFNSLSKTQAWPDLLIIDGGKGQVAVAKKVLDSLQVSGVTLLGIAKGPSRKAGRERLILAEQTREFILPEESQALHLLQAIRDQAHAFALGAHRKKRQKASFDSTLESIEGVGAKRRKALLSRFGGLRELSKAPMEEIAKVSGISEKLALRIYHSFHGRS